MANMPDKDLIATCSQIIYDNFVRYNNAFHRMTRRAQVRFEQRDWKGHQEDIAERVYLYEKSVRRVVLLLRRLLGTRVNDHALWNEIRTYFGNRLGKVPDSGFIKTFFNSVTRRIFDTVGVDPQLEFVSSSLEEDIEMARSLNLRRYPYWGSIEKIFETILEDFSFRVPYSDVTVNATRIADEIEKFMQTQPDKHDDEFLRFEFIDTFFYQSARAYMIGRIIMKKGILPIVIAFKNTDNGIDVDAVLLAEDEVSIVFSYTRSYFFADPNSEVDKGLVMIVYTLPSYDLVFKVMRDQFGYPKTISHADVVEKYKMVSKHDRAGRLIDTQDFRNMEFPINRFSKELLDELLNEAAHTVSIVDDNLLFSRVYVERRVRPLNLYIHNVDRKDAELAILDYGHCLKYL